LLVTLDLCRTGLLYYLADTCRDISYCYGQ
jgi:hypothetical protein